MKRKLDIINRLFLVLILLVCSTISTPVMAKSKTLGDLKNELDQKIKEYNDNKQHQDATNAQIKQAEKRISEIQIIIEANATEVIRLEEEINELNQKIIDKEQEIKEVIKFYQVSNGTSTYLEYIFGASNFTDLIYRFAISEQLLDYNDKLVDEFNNMIDENNRKKNELAKQEVKLSSEQDNLESELKKLGSKLKSFTDVATDISEEIASQRAAIKIYEEQYKCKDEDEISVCTLSQLPADTSFWRPLKAGVRTSEYGYRSYNLNGKPKSDFHTGIDISTSPSTNVPVYASAAGVVISIVEKASCGGNKIYIHHNINGKTYTTSYLHLRKIMVSVGDVVTKDTQIAIMGGNPRIETWDRCSTGAHLHFSVNTGLYLKDYSSWSSYVSHTINPRTIVNFPSGGTPFHDRTTKY